MLLSILRPSLKNALIWLNAGFLLILLLTGVAEPFTIVMVYFFETLLIGLMQLFKMAITAQYGRAQRQEPGKSGGKMLFFIVHFSFFVAVQSIFVFALFELIDENIKEPFKLITNFKYVLSYDGIGYSLLVVFFFLALQTYLNFFHNKKYNEFTVDQLIVQPYLRIVIQQFVAIFSVFVGVLSPSGLILALILMGFRLFVDLSLNYIGNNVERKEKIANALSKDTPEKAPEIRKVLDLF
jgi:hypothetical protein